MPEATGRVLGQRDRGAGSTPARSRRPRAARSTRLSSSAREIRRRRARRSSATSVSLRRDGDLVAGLGEDHQTVEQVKAVGTTADDMQVEIDLGAGEHA